MVKPATLEFARQPVRHPDLEKTMAWMPGNCCAVSGMTAMVSIHY